MNLDIRNVHPVLEERTARLRRICTLDAPAVMLANECALVIRAWHRNSLWRTGFAFLLEAVEKAWWWRVACPCFAALCRAGIWHHRDEEVSALFAAGTATASLKRMRRTVVSDPTDFEINLWAVKFMGWRELELPTTLPHIYAAVASDEVRWFMRENGAIGFVRGDSGRWSPIDSPAQTVLLIAKATKQGWTVETDTSDRSSWARASVGERSWTVNVPGDATLAWPRAACAVIVQAFRDLGEKPASLPEIIHA